MLSVDLSTHALGLSRHAFSWLKYTCIQLTQVHMHSVDLSTHALRSICVVYVSARGSFSQGMELIYGLQLMDIVCVCVCVHMAMYVYTCMHRCMCVYVCTYLCICIYVYMCAYVCRHLFYVFLRSIPGYVADLYNTIAFDECSRVHIAIPLNINGAQNCCIKDLLVVLRQRLHRMTVEPIPLALQAKHADLLATLLA